MLRVWGRPAPTVETSEHGGKSESDRFRDRARAKNREDAHRDDQRGAKLVKLENIAHVVGPGEACYSLSDGGAAKRRHEQKRARARDKTRGSLGVAFDHSLHRHIQTSRAPNDSSEPRDTSVSDCSDRHITCYHPPVHDLA